MILDTSFLIDVLRGSNTVTEAEQLIDDRGTARVSSITVMELWEGIHRADSSDGERTAVENLLSDLREVPFDRECAMAAAKITVELDRNGTPIENADVLIAATARVNDVPVVTNNIDHFQRIDGLELLAY